MPASDISDRQRQILDLILHTVQERGYPPSVREIGEAVGLNSPSTVHSHLSALVKSGYLRRDPSKPRAIEVTAPGRVQPDLRRAPVRDVPLLGRIAAGSPILAEEDIEDILPLPTQIVGNDPVFMLRVRGDSMVGDGIHDGDLVVIRRQADADDGDIVAALIDGEEATVKRLRRSSGKVTLVPANPAYEPMVFTEGVQVLGRVVAVLRRLR
ncbi:MAG: transcriptional repressor LexA [Acidimicrobiia bacterium]|jgi:repressor LexA|nr:transcriptional repressor LexA [Acidimicrobiia bacterium]